MSENELVEDISNLTFDVHDVTNQAILKHSWFNGEADEFEVEGCYSLQGKPRILISLTEKQSDNQKVYAINIEHITNLIIQRIKEKQEQNHD